MKRKNVFTKKLYAIAPDIGFHEKLLLLLVRQNIQIPTD